LVRQKSPLRLLLKALVFSLCTSVFVPAQDDDNWPSLGYLRKDYKTVSVVAHIRIQEAEITGRVGGYENWKISAVVLESFKGKFKKGDAVVYFHGAEAGLKREYFDEEKLVFLLAGTDSKTKEVRYSVLENSTLPVTADRLNKLRLIRKQTFKNRRRSTLQETSKLNIAAVAQTLCLNSLVSHGAIVSSVIIATQGSKFGPAHSDSWTCNIAQNLIWHNTVDF